MKNAPDPDTDEQAGSEPRPGIGSRRPERHQDDHDESTCQDQSDDANLHRVGYVPDFTVSLQCELSSKRSDLVPAVPSPSPSQLE